MDKTVETTMQNLEKNGIKAYYVETKGEVVPLVKTLVCAGSSVSNGGSESLKETGVIDLLKSGCYEYIDRTGLTGEELRQCYIRAFGCDAYFCSSNAVTQHGELYNVDGNSNRVACIVYGPRQVIMVVGVNKIVADIDEAVMRVKQIAAPLNTKRLACDTACAYSGECISAGKNDAPVCAGCSSKARICCNYVISARQRHINRIKVIIVNETLGY
ncbi:MAG: lactate utilization protein [Clostridiales bacterium]|nr:lactate utilization protein [Clostridiales bacterium]